MGWRDGAATAGLLSWLWLAACAPGSGTFQCTDDSSCIANGVGGICQDVGFCSFPDPTCDTDQRYGELAGGAFAGACVPDGGGTGGTDADGSAGQTGAGPTTVLETTTGTSETTPDTSMGAMTTPSGTSNPTMTTSNVTMRSTTDMTAGETTDPTAEDSSTTEDEPIIAPACADFNFGDANAASAMLPDVSDYEDNFGTDCLPGSAPEVVFYWVAPADGTYEFYADAPSGVDVVGGLWDACDGMEYVCDDDGGDVVDSRIVREVQAGEAFIWVVNVYGDLENGIDVSISEASA